MTDTHGSLKWTWMDSRTDITHFDWYIDQPNDEGDGTFVTMYCGNDFVWYDLPAIVSSNNRPYICEADIF